MASPSQMMTLTNLISRVQSGPGGEGLQMRTGTGMNTCLCVSESTLVYLIPPLGSAEIFSENSVLAPWCSFQVGWRTRTGTPGRGSRPVLSKGWPVGHWLSHLSVFLYIDGIDLVNTQSCCWSTFLQEFLLSTSYPIFGRLYSFCHFNIYFKFIFPWFLVKMKIPF